MIRQLEEKANELFGDAKEIIVTGLVPLLTRTIDLVMLSMVISYSAAAVIITLMMILLLTDWRLGLWSMIPNFLPILMGLGVMGALDLPLDMASMLVGSIALGLAVDDTVHFLNNFRVIQTYNCTFWNIQPAHYLGLLISPIFTKFTN